MPKVLQVVIYTSVSDEAKLADYAVLAGPAMMAKGARFLARGLPIAVREAGQKTRTVVIEWRLRMRVITATSTKRPSRPWTVAPSASFAISRRSKPHFTRCQSIKMDP